MTWSRCATLALVVAVACAVAVPSGGAQPEQPDAAADRPWAAGVSDADQHRATELLRAGNALLFEFLFAEALTTYEEAIAAWDHPAIRFNMAVALYNLGRLVDAHDNIARALRYGAAPLEKSVFAQAVRYEKLLDEQLAEVVIVCGEPGAAVALDGEALFTGPGRATRRLMPGQHQVVATKPGHIADTRVMKLVPGDPETVSLELVPVDGATITRRRFARWKPWAVVGAGAALGLVGATLRWRAGVNFAQYDRDYPIVCPGPVGCFDDPADGSPVVPASLASLRSRAMWQSDVGIGALIGGGAVVVLGLVGVIVNQPRAVRVDPGATRRASPSRQIGVAPLLGPSVVGVRGHLRF